MYTDALLVLRAYIPLTLEKGMLFLKNTDPLQLYELEKNIKNSKNVTEYLNTNGPPYELAIFEASPWLNQLATHNEIGWVEDNEDEIHEISLNEINMILENDGKCQMETTAVDENCNIPVFNEEKVIIKLIEN